MEATTRPARRRQPAWPRDRTTILDRYLELLDASHSPLMMAGDDVVRQVRLQLLAVIDAVAVALGMSEEPLIPVGSSGLSESIGRSRAGAAIHPSQSLQAASLIFEAALPTLTTRLTAAGEDRAEHIVAVALNREILQRMGLAAGAYVDHLLAKAESSNRDERRRLSRELHDVAAPAVAIGLQNLELYEIYAATDAARAAGKITAAKAALRDALATIRNLSAESRENVATRGLREALRRYLETVPNSIQVHLAVPGAIGHVIGVYAEELFLIVREAVRNAVLHAEPSSITVAVHSDGTMLTAEVTDDGRGVDVGSLERSEPHIGIDSMHERAELLGATIGITSSLGRGTTVTVRIPLPVGSISDVPAGAQQ